MLMSDEQIPIHNKKDNLDFFANETKSNNIPLNVNYGSENVDYFHEPLPQNQPAPLEQPYGFLKNIYHGGMAQNAISSVIEFGKRRTADLNPIDDQVDPNYRPDPKEVDGIDSRYAHYLMGATGPKDFSRRRNYILDQMDEDRRIANGSFAGQVIGGFTLGNADPSVLIPVSRAFKFATASETFLQAIPKALPGVGLASVSHEAAEQATQLGGNLEDFFINSFAETVLGTVFMGALPAGGSLIEAMKVRNATGAISMMNKGIEPRPVLDAKGVVKGWKAAPMDSSVSAAEVDMAQAYLDGSMAKNSLYSIPYLGEKIGYAAGKTGQVLGGWISPQVRMSNSKFPVMRGFINNIADHGFETEGVAQGRAQPDSFEADFNEVKGHNKGLYNLYNGLYMLRNGITYESDKFGSRTRANIEAAVKKNAQDDWVTRETFGREVQYAMISNTPSKHDAVNQAARLFKETQNGYYAEWRKLHGISEKVFPSKTAEGYATRSYNHPYLTTDQGEKSWISAASNELKKYDDEIQSLLAPINNAKEEYKRLEASHNELIKKEKVSDQEIKGSSNNLMRMKKEVDKLIDNLQDEIRNNHDLHLHAEDLNGVSASEARQIKALKAPIKLLEKEYDKQNELVKTLKSQQSSKASSAKGRKKAESAKRNVALSEELKAKLEPEEAKLKELRDKLDQAEIDLEDRIRNGEIDDSLYYKIKDSNRYVLKDESNRLKLRDVHESDFHRQTVAKAQYDSIMNNTSEDLINNTLYGLFPGLNPNPVKARSIMYRDKFLYDNNFLHPEPVISVMNYNLALGRQNAFKRMLNRLTVNGTPEELVEKLKQQYEGFKDEIRRKYANNQPKLEKELRKLNKEYKTNQSDLKNSFEKMLGKTKGSPKLRQYTTMANLFAVSTKLGFLPFTMSTDLMANVFKHGFWPTVKFGLAPMLKSVAGILNTEEGKAIRANAAHAYLAENQMALTYADRNWMGAAQDYTPIQGKLMNGMEKLAHYSMNFSGANHIQNLNEMTSAMIIQSKIMNSMDKFLKGELKEGSKDYKDLLKYGLDPKDWADKFLNGWKESGKASAGFGSFLAKYWEWTDLEAANKMSRAINKAVKDTVIRRGMFDAPFAMDDPLINSLFLFKGYVLASLNRFLVPLLQRPDADKLIGTMFMLSVGATQNPLRRIINGQDPSEEDDHMLRNAIRDGGVFSILGDTWQDLNFLTSNYFQDLVSNERYRNRLEMGVFNGPIGGIANDMTRIIGMGLSGELNQTDLKRLTTLVPMAYSWQFRALNSKMIEGLGLPKTREQAHKLKELAS